MSRLEADTESDLIDFAKKRGVLTYKFVSPSHNGVPDRVFIGPKGTLFLEIKRKGKKPRPLQDREIRRINAQENPTTKARWTDNTAEGQHFIEQFCLA